MNLPTRVPDRIALAQPATQLPPDVADAIAVILADVLVLEVRKKTLYRFPPTIMAGRNDES
jgi:hypothetical protein